MYLNLGISMVLKDFKLLRIEDVDFDVTVDDFKIKVAEKVNFLKENIELAYCGRILDSSTTLKNNGLKEGFIVNILQKKEKEASLTTLPALESEIPDLVRVFQILATRNAYRRILQKLNKPEVLENIISTTPGLSDDATAIVILQHPELLAKLGDANAVRRVVEKHPTLANAARNLVAAVQNDMLTSPTSVSSASLNNSVSFVVGSDDEEMEFMGNGDSESRTLENSTEDEQPVNLITTSQVAAALASTTTATVRPSSDSSANTATSSASIPSITPEMMSTALQGVIASTSTADTSASSSQQERENQQLQDVIVTVTQLEELRKLGFTNDAMNIQALQLASGDLLMAVNLILSGFSDDN